MQKGNICTEGKFKVTIEGKGHYALKKEKKNWLLYVCVCVCLRAENLPYLTQGAFRK